MIRQLVGDCRVTLPTLDAGVAQACITSPPYYGLRCYGTPDLVWGGDAGHTHSFEDLGTRTKGGVGQNKGLANRELSLAAIDGQQITPLGSMCSCGAWLGSLGLEPTPDCGRPAVKLRAGLTERERAYVVKRLREIGVLK